MAAILLLVLSSAAAFSTAESVGAAAASNITIPGVVQPADELTPIHQEMGDLYQHDMMLTPNQIQILSGVSNRGQANLIYRWPEGTDGFPFVPYQFIGSVDQSAIADSISHWESKTCIKFEERPGTTDPHLKFEKLSGCWSYVGYVGFLTDFENGQTVSIGSGCNFLGIVVHEIGHAMGLFHEQSRPTRDDYVVILTENIQSGREDQFDKQDPSRVNYHGVPYDFTSDMHYSSFGFSKNGGMTIATADPWNQGLIGQRNGLSHRDTLLVNRMYSCIDKWLASCNMSSDPCQNDGYIGSSCSCVCPPGTSGTNCETVDNDYYAAVRVDCNVNVTTEGTISSTNYPASYPAGTCATWIVAPECMAPKITFTHFDVPCSDELIVNDISRYSGSSHCGSSITVGQTFTASTNEMVLILFGGTNSNIGWSATLVFESINGCTTPTTQPSTTSTTQPPTTSTTQPPTTSTTQPPTTSTTQPPTTSTTQPPTTSTTQPPTTSTTQPPTTSTTQPSTTSTTQPPTTSTTQPSTTSTTQPPTTSTTQPSTTSTTQPPTTSTTQPPTTSTTQPSTTPGPVGPRCGLEMIGSNYHWTSPGFADGDFYPNSFTCSISDVMPEPMQTVYTLNSFSLERKRSKKCVDSVSLDIPFSRFITLCRPKKSVWKVPNSRFRAVFESDYNVPYPGFDITIRHVKTSCHQIIDLTSGIPTTGFIRSPRFPKRFPKHSQCEWWIRAPTGSRIQLSVTHMRMRNSAGCTKAYVVIDKSGTAVYEAATSDIVCGRQKINVVSSGDTLNVVFDGGRRKAKGFKARYTIIP